MRIPSPGPISRTRRPGVGAASARIASRTSTSARKFCERRVAGTQAGLPERPADGVGIEPRCGRRARGRRRAGHRRASGSDGRASRSRPARSPAAKPPRAGRPDHRPVVGAQARPRDDEREAAARPPRRPGARAGRRSRRRRRRARSSAPRSPRPPASSWSTSTSTTESWKPKASSATVGVAERRVGVVGAAGPRRPGPHRRSAGPPS